MRRLPLERYIPAGSRPVSRDGVPAVVYVTDGPGRPTAIGYRGRQNRSAFYHSFRSIEQRDRCVEQFLDGVTAEVEARAARQAAVREFRHSLKPGDILLYSWGWEQTNVDFFEVTRTTEKAVWVRKIGCEPVSGSEGGMSDRVRPAAGKFIGPELRKVPRTGNALSMDCGVALPWDPEDVARGAYRSWYA